MLLSLSATSVQGEQLFDPYGHRRYTSGVLGTDKGYTGQFTDTATGLTYDHARYYLRHIGVFLSPDHVQGNAQGMDPYAYVGGNPVTKTDPTGEVNCPAQGSCGGDSGGGEASPPPPPPTNPCELSGGNPEYCGGNGNHNNNNNNNNGGCHGGGTRMGASGCYTGAQPTDSGPQLQDPCAGNKICNAQSDANQAGALFAEIAGKLLLGAGLAEAAALILEALAAALAGSIWLAWLAPIVSGLGALVESLATAAAGAAGVMGIVSAEFWSQGSKHTPGDWSRSAMESFQNEVGVTIAVGMTIVTVITFTKTVLGSAATKVGSVLGSAQPALLKTVQLFNNYANIIAGANIMSYADSWIERMDSDLGYA